MLEGVFWRGFICLYLSQQKLIDDTYLLLSLIFGTLLFHSVSFKMFPEDHVFIGIDVNCQQMIRGKTLVTCQYIALMAKVHFLPCLVDLLNV